MNTVSLLPSSLAAAGSAPTFEVRNPSDGALLAYVPDMGREETRHAIEAAKGALPAWSARTARQRAQILRDWYNLILAHHDELARLLTLEQGKPLAEARSEILYGAAFVEWFAEEGKRLYGDVVPTPAPDKRLLVLKQPIGVVGAITPWNFPNAMVTRKIAPALAAGCTIVLKPAEDTPLSALALGELARRAGVPEGVVSIVTSSRARDVAEVLTSSPDVRKLSFTGSTQVGKMLMRQCSDTLKKLSLELGGNAPLIVFEDADLDAAVAGAIVSKFRNAGQTCVCANRILVHASVMQVFAAKFATAVAALRVGDGLQEGTTIGPLINEAAVSKVESLVREAVHGGAHTVAGGSRHANGGNFFSPTVLAGVTPDMAIAREEIFGPVAPLYAFETEAEALRIANDTPYGLAAYFYTRDLSRAFRVAEALEYGMVGLNEVTISNEAAPFGGVKESGIGREGSKYGLDDYVEIKYFCLGGLSSAAR
jgi:succinate-semialdehyde dehydrogenase/glutarate-semialdehyde dehydrogenase